MTDERLTETLTSLLRGELAAVETYDTAIGNLGEGNPKLATMLTGMRDDHEAAAEWLRGHIILNGAEPADRAGPWGAFAKALGGTASLVSERAALQILAEGERQGLTSYDEAAAGAALDDASCTQIAKTIRPRQQRHIAMLDEYLESGRIDPEATPRQPTPGEAAIEAIVAATDLTRDEKIERLQRMSYDVRELDVASDEGMAGSSSRPAAGVRLEQIEAALQRLDADAVATNTKH